MGLNDFTPIKNRIWISYQAIPEYELEPGYDDEGFLELFELNTKKVGA